MNCWKSINISRQYGNPRIFVLSLLTILITFVISYTFISVFSATVPLKDDHFFVFFFAIIFSYPLHKMLHVFPLLFMKSKNIKINIVLKRYFPVLRVTVCEPISKNMFLISLMFPFFLITFGLIGCMYTFVSYVHYLTILLSVHVGMCLADFIYIRDILGSPINSFVEENDEGFEILVAEKFIS